MEEFWNLENYSIHHKMFPLTSKHYVFKDANSHNVAYGWMKPFKLKEELRIFSDAKHNDCILEVIATNIVDGWGEYLFINPEDKTLIGKAQRKALKSIIQATWEVYNSDNKLIGLMKDDWAGEELFERMKAHRKKAFSGFEAPTFKIKSEESESITYIMSHSRLLHVQIPIDSLEDYRIFAAMAMILIAVEWPMQMSMDA